MAFPLSLSFPSFSFFSAQSFGRELRNRRNCSCPRRPRRGAVVRHPPSWAGLKSKNSSRNFFYFFLWFFFYFSVRFLVGKKYSERKEKNLKPYRGLVVGVVVPPQNLPKGFCDLFFGAAAHLDCGISRKSPLSIASDIYWLFAEPITGGRRQRHKMDLDSYSSFGRPHTSPTTTTNTLRSVYIERERESLDYYYCYT